MDFKLFGSYGLNLPPLEEDKDFETMRMLYEQTKNPFFVWEVLMRSFERQVRMPSWAYAYLQDTTKALAGINDELPQSNWQNQVLLGLGFNIKKSTGPGSPVREYQNLSLGSYLFGLLICGMLEDDRPYLGLSANDKIAAIADKACVGASKARECLFEYAEMIDAVDDVKSFLNKNSGQQ